MGNFLKNHTTYEAGLSLALLCLSACANTPTTGGELPLPTPVPLSVTDTNPKDAQSDVDVSIPITATFNNDLDSSTIGATNFMLSDGTSNMSGSVVCDQATATLTLSSPLSLLASYKVTLDAGIKDQKGTELAPMSWNFKTRDGSWKTTPTAILNEPNNSAPRLAADGLGNAIAVWQQGINFTFNIMAARYAPGVGWEVPQQLDTVNPAVIATNPAVAADSNGNAIAVWLQEQDVFASRFSASAASWSAPIKLDTEASVPSHVRIAMDAEGNAFAVWQQYSSTASNIYAARFAAATNTWENTIAIDGTGDSYAPEIAVDSAGNMFAVWYQGSSPSNLKARRYVKGSGWKTVQSIEEAAGDTTNLQVAMSPAGNPIIVWQQVYNGVQSIWASEAYDPVTDTWDTSKARVIEAEAGNATAPRLAVDSMGNAIAVWTQPDGINKDIVWASRFSAASKQWDSPTKLETDNAEDALNPSIAFDKPGNALVVWEKKTSKKVGLRANRYVLDQGWKTASDALVDDASINALSPQLAILSNGKALAAFEFNGIFQISFE